MKLLKAYTNQVNKQKGISIAWAKYGGIVAAWAP